MMVFVAGASGAIGRRLLPQLVAAGHEVTAITRSEEKLEPIESMGARAVVCDVFDAAWLRQAVADSGAEAVIHQLTDLPQRVRPRRLKRYYAANDRVRQESTANLLDAAQRAGVRRIVAQSVAFWYAPGNDKVKTETDPLYLEAPAPIGPAVQTMKSVEDAVTGAEEIEGIALRYGFLYGPGTWYTRDGDVGRQVRQWRYPIIGKGEQVYSFIHLDDAAAATVAALERAAPGIYNVVDDEPAPAREWMPTFAKALAAPRPLRVPAFVARLAAGNAPLVWMASLRGASNAKVKRELGWSPRFPSWREGFLEGLGRETSR